MLCNSPVGSLHHKIGFRETDQMLLEGIYSDS